jgi:hypothetical protein
MRTGGRWPAIMPSEAKFLIGKAGADNATPVSTPSAAARLSDALKNRRGRKAFPKKSRTKN